MDNLEKNTNYKLTENGSLSHKSTLSAVYDMFAFGGAYRNRTEDECIEQFIKALDENEALAMKCLFYLRDIRGGQGERRYFRVCFKWLCDNYPEIAKRNLEYISEFGRWDDLVYICSDTKVEKDALQIISRQLKIDIQCKTPSLLAKWLPSENASSAETRRLGGKIRSYLTLSHKEYRKLLSDLRSKIKIVETLMSQNRWDEIEFDKIPSRAGLIYRNAFARRDIIAKKYEKFITDENTKVNAGTLYPYDIIRKALSSNEGDEIQRAALQKTWENLPDYFNGTEQSMIAVVDTSGSMTVSMNKNIRPIDVAISLGVYCGERNKGEFANKYITFASKPELIDIRGRDIYSKANRIREKCLIDNTNLEAVFDLIRKTAIQSNANSIPKTIIIISDMEIDYGSDEFCMLDFKENLKTTADTLMERIRKKWVEDGLEMPKLVYWNVNARNDTILDLGPDVSCVSGCSPIIFEQVMTGKTGFDLCLNKLLSERYKNVK